MTIYKQCLNRLLSVKPKRCLLRILCFVKTLCHLQLLATLVLATVMMNGLVIGTEMETATTATIRNTQQAFLETCHQYFIFVLLFIQIKACKFLLRLDAKDVDIVCALGRTKVNCAVSEPKLIIFRTYLRLSTISCSTIKCPLSFGKHKNICYR